MELNKNTYDPNDPLRKTDPSNDEEFENPDVDPGFNTDTDEEMYGLDDERSDDIDSNESIEEMRGEDKENDALNYKNDREHGAYNPKNI